MIREFCSCAIRVPMSVSFTSLISNILESLWCKSTTRYYANALKKTGEIMNRDNFNQSGESHRRVHWRKQWTKTTNTQKQKQWNDHQQQKHTQLFTSQFDMLKNTPSHDSLHLHISARQFFPSRSAKTEERYSYRKRKNKERKRERKEKEKGYLVFIESGKRNERQPTGSTWQLNEKSETSIL